MSKYLNVTYKLVWFEYFDRESTDISNIFWCFEYILAILDIYF